MGRDQIMKESVCHAEVIDFLQVREKSEIVFKQSCDAVILESSSWHSGRFTWIYKWKNKEIIKMLEFLSRYEIKDLFSVLMCQQ